MNDRDLASMIRRLVIGPSLVRFLFGIVFWWIVWIAVGLGLLALILAG